MRHRLLAALLFTALTAPTALTAQSVDVTSYHFRIDLPDTGSTIKGWASVFFDTRPGYDDTLRLDLVGMTVDHVFGMRTMRAVPFAHDGRVLRIASHDLGRGSLGVMVQYHGAPTDGLVMRAANARGHRSFFGDNWPNRARFWLPTVDHPSDKARVLWSIRAPAGMRVIANAPQCRGTAGPGDRGTGNPVPRSPRPPVPRCNESATIPTYTMVLGATRFSVSRHRPAVSGADTVPIEVWSYPEDSAFADSVPFRRATEIVETMTRLIGPFPYSKLAHVQSSTRYGGMENATEIFYDERAWARGTMREGTVRHETAHQWFGDAVTEADWHHVWLSESFANYFDAVVAGELDGDTAMARVMAGDRAGYLASSVVNRPIIDTAIVDPNDVLNANTYPKGAWVLHMLRQTVGDAAFFRALREFYRVYRDSSVLTDALQRKMEEASGMRLDWFFHQWLWQPGYPRIAASLDSGVLRLQEVQPDAWGAFRLDRLPIAIAGEGCPSRAMVDLAASRDVQVVSLPACRAATVRVDPDGRWLVSQP